MSDEKRISREGNQQASPVPDGWGAVRGDVKRSASVSSSRPRRVITLQAPRTSLELPSDGPPTGELTEQPSEALELPSDWQPSPAVSDDAPLAEAAAEDGWARARNEGSVPPPRKESKSERPSAPLPAKKSSESSDVVRLVTARSRPPGSSEVDLAGQMRDRLAVGDFSGSLQLAELILGADSRHDEAKRIAARAKEHLVQFHLARLGGLSAVLGVRVAGADVRWLGLDHRAGFLLSLVDGTTTVEEIVDVSSMPRHEALRLLAELLEASAVTRID